jgi:hypothetical protein
MKRTKNSWLRNLAEQLIERHDHPKAAEALGVGIARMGAGANTAGFAKLENVPDNG